MAESPIRLPTPPNRELARSDGYGTTDDGGLPATHGRSLIERPDAPPAIAQPWSASTRWTRRAGIGKLAWIVIAVVLPTLASAVYYLGIASDQYVSNFLCVVRPVDDDASVSGGAFHTSTAISQTAIESNVVVQYIKSAELVKTLDSQMGLRALYSTTQADFLSRLDPKAPNEELVSYWNGKVEPYYNMTTGTVSVQIKAFTPQDAQQIATQVIRLSEALVNAMSERARRDAVKLDEQEVNDAGERLRQLRQQMLDFRNQHQTIDPRKEADSNLSLITKLREDLALARADLKTYASAKDSPTARVLRNRINALQEQIAAASAPMTGKNGRDDQKPLSASVGGYEDLDARRLIAEKYYDSALSALERAKHDADRKMTYLAVFDPPNLPQSSTYPRRAMSLGLTMLAGFGLWIFGLVIVHSVREHV